MTAFILMLPIVVLHLDEWDAVKAIIGQTPPYYKIALNRIVRLCVAIHSVRVPKWMRMAVG